MKDIKPVTVEITFKPVDGSDCWFWKTDSGKLLSEVCEEAGYYDGSASRLLITIHPYGTKMEDLR